MEMVVGAVVVVAVLWAIKKRLDRNNGGTGGNGSAPGGDNLK